MSINEVSPRCNSARLKSFLSQFSVTKIQSVLNNLMIARHRRLLACLLDVDSLRRPALRLTGAKHVRPVANVPLNRRSFHQSQRRAQVEEHTPERTNDISRYFHLLPRSCPGCGALTHNDPRNKAGFYGRKSIQKDSSRLVKQDKHQEVEGSDEVESEDIAPSSNVEETNQAESPNKLSQLVCDRCHDLDKENLGVSISHPTIESIAAIIDQSPFQHNHVYLVLDAADFPASLVPKVFDKLDLVHQRSQNRRAKSTMFKGGRTTTVSFIITRSDILLPSQEQTDQLMPWFIKTLRATLGRDNERARMGNVHLVSSKRGWWTKELKEDIRQRGGGNWMVGKVNVGKSNLFEVLYPKGSTEAEPDFEKLRESANRPSEDYSSALMPPPQPLVPYPTLPLVSSLPGTTASPIRLPFAASNGKRGELIDLPGMFRSSLEAYVTPENQTSLVMTQRPKGEQISLRSHQSLLVGGGLVRITPYSTSHNLDKDTESKIPTKNETVILAFPFIPWKVPVHATSTEKASAIQSQTLESGIPTIMKPGVGDQISSAGIFTLDKDVTKTHAAKLLRGRSRDTEKKIQDLPFRIFATDIIIEGVGWVELTAQVRLKRSAQDIDRPIPRTLPTPAPESTVSGLEALEAYALSKQNPTSKAFQPPEVKPPPVAKPPSPPTDPWSSIPRPQVEIFTPLGKGIQSRDSLGIYHRSSTHERQGKKGPKKSPRRIYGRD